MCPSGKPTRPHAPLPTTLPYKPAFDVIDTDRDGLISPEDLTAFYTSLNTNPDSNSIRTMMSVADTNNDGYVEYAEFERVLMKKEKGCNGGFLEDVFNVMDKDGDGMVSFEDLKGFMEVAGLRADDEGIRGMIVLGGGGLENGVSVEGFRGIFQDQFGFDL